MPSRYTLAQAKAKFFSRVDRTTGANGCWNWLGSKAKLNYGVFYTGFDYAGTRYAHRWHWIVERGPLGPEFDLDHLCRNPACVRLDHLEPVSHKVNVLRGVGWGAVNKRKRNAACGHPLIERWGRRACWDCRKTSLKKADLKSKRKRRAARTSERAGD